MRQGQQNKRMRGRGRKVSNPLNRVYESNGPDVKVRGTASHVAEKYMSLSRDAQVSGDPVSSENYLQHAEHYLRIVAAAQSQNQPQPQRPGAGPVGGDDEAEMNGAETPQRARNGADAVGDGESAGETKEAVPARGRRRRPAAARDEASQGGDDAETGNAEAGKAESKASREDAGGEGSAEDAAAGSGETPEAVA